MIRLLIVDDHTAIRQALTFLFEQEQDFTVVGQAGSLAEARTMLTGIDVAIIDVELRDGNGIALIGEIRAANPQCSVLILTSSMDRMEYARAIEAGAAGVLHKAAQVTEIISAARRINAGEFLMKPAEIVDLLRAAGQQREEHRGVQTMFNRLTPREREVLQALAEGLSDKEIAQRLQISHETQRTHVMNLLSKLGVHSRLQAVVFGVRHGFLKIH